jgi:photosystem II stability/assembly factor-like uncharacterized protein
MNSEGNDDQSKKEGWSWTVAPAIPSADGRIWVKLLAYDGEYPFSYVYEHPAITTQGTLLYDVETWLSDIWRAPSGRLYAAGEAGQMHTYDHGRWYVNQTPVRSMLTCVWGLDDDHIYATTKGGIFLLDGKNWNYVTKGHDVYIDRLRGIASDDLYAVGRHGLMLHFDGTSWHRLDIPTNMNLKAVYPIDRKIVYAVGHQGIVLIGSGNRWKVLDFGDIDFVDVVEYQDNIYIAATEKGVFRLQDDELVTFRDDIRASRLTTGGGFFCVAGNLSIHRFDGKSWESYNYTISSEA